MARARGQRSNVRRWYRTITFFVRKEWFPWPCLSWSHRPTNDLSLISNWQLTVTVHHLHDEYNDGHDTATGNDAVE